MFKFWCSIAICFIIYFQIGNGAACPGGWGFENSYPEVCYRIVDTDVDSWEVAKDKCALLNATLPIFRTLDEMYSFQRMSKYSFNCEDQTWLGLSYNSSVNNFTWNDGTSMTFSRGIPPNNLTMANGNVTFMNAYGNYWSQTPLTTMALRYFCQLRISEPIPNYGNILTNYENQNFCPTGWYYDTSTITCYYYNSNYFANFNEAQTQCSNLYPGATLPVMYNASDFTAYRNLLENTMIPCVTEHWIGLSDQQNVGVFRWIDGNLPCFTSWVSGYPTNNVTSTCTFSVGWSMNPNWQNADCAQQKAFVCQYKPSFQKAMDTDAGANSVLGSSITELGCMLLCLNKSECSIYVWLGVSGKTCYMDTTNTWSTGGYVGRVSGRRINNTIPCLVTQSTVISTTTSTIQTTKLTTAPGTTILNNNGVCPSGWTTENAYPQICYFLAPTSATWLSAIDYCNQYNSTLPIFRTLDESFSFARLSGLSSLNCFGNSWIGISYNYNLSNFTWLDGTSLTFSQGIPPNSLVISNGNVSVMNIAGGNYWWQTWPSATAYRYYCQRRINTGNCPYQWYYDNTTQLCYYYNNNNFDTFNKAQSFCSNLVTGGTLPTFCTNAEFTAFNNFLHTANVPCAATHWIGLNDQQQLGTFNWVDGSSPSFWAWDTNYPSCGGNSTCAISVGWLNNKWQNIPCDTRKGFVCQYRMPYKRLVGIQITSPSFKTITISSTLYGVPPYGREDLCRSYCWNESQCIAYWYDGRAYCELKKTTTPQVNVSQPYPYIQASGIKTSTFQRLIDIEITAAIIWSTSIPSSVYAAPGVYGREDICQSYCLNNSQCVSYYYDGRAVCRLHASSTPQQTYSAPGQYVAASGIKINNTSGCLTISTNNTSNQTSACKTSLPPTSTSTTAITTTTTTQTTKVTTTSKGANTTVTSSSTSIRTSQKTNATSTASTVKKGGISTIPVSSPAAIRTSPKESTTKIVSSTSTKFASSARESLDVVSTKSINSLTLNEAHSNTAQPNMTTVTTAPPIVTLPQALTNMGIEKGQVEPGASLAATIQDSSSFLLNTLNDSAKQQLGFQKVDLINTCSFNNVPCDFEKDFTDIYSPLLGNCFTYNPGLHPIHWSTRAGSLNGLRILLAASQSDYSCTAQVAGFRVVIHENNVTPFPDTQGFNIPPGTTSSFSLLNRRTLRVDSPSGSCATSKFGLFDGNYSIEACQRYCFQTKLIDSCKCADPRYPLPPNATYCSSEQKTCLDFSQQCEAVLAGDKVCKCPPPCNETLYPTTVSTARIMTNDLEITYCNGSSNSTMCNGEFSKNFALLYIYYQQITSYHMVEISPYGIVQLLSDFAGMAGILLGFGTLTFLEILFLFALCMKDCWMHTFGYQQL